MSKVIVLSGVSGSGKSTYTQKLLASILEGDVSTFVKSRIVSADYFFHRDGKYQFDASKLGQAHAECFRNFITAMMDGCNTVVVDNTNTNSDEIAPYMLGAAAFGYDAEIHTLGPGSMRYVDYYLMCEKRNKHGVNFDTIKAQHTRILNRRLPPWWKVIDASPIG